MKYIQDHMCGECGKGGRVAFAIWTYANGKGGFDLSKYNVCSAICQDCINKAFEEVSPDVPEEADSNI